MKEPVKIVHTQPSRFNKSMSVELTAFDCVVFFALDTFREGNIVRGWGGQAHSNQVAALLGEPPEAVRESLGRLGLAGFLMKTVTSTVPHEERHYTANRYNLADYAENFAKGQEQAAALKVVADYDEAMAIGKLAFFKRGQGREQLERKCP